MKKTIMNLSLVLVSLAFFSCEKEGKGDEPTPEGNTINKTVTLSRETTFGDDWIYFSFSKGEEVTVAEADHYNNTEWDIAFNRHNVRTNGGKSGNGQGGAYDLGKVDFDGVVALPANAKLILDGDHEISDIGPGFPPPSKTSTGNSALSGAVVFTGPPPAYTPTYHVYVVKTASGKYVKYICNNFYDKTGDSGYVTFEFTYQPDGTSTF